jgi:hypothetical protein
VLPRSPVRAIEVQQIHRSDQHGSARSFASRSDNLDNDRRKMSARRHGKHAPIPMQNRCDWWRLSWSNSSIIAVRAGSAGTAPVG